MPRRATDVLDLRPVLFVLGALLIVLAVAMLVPMFADMAYGDGHWMDFALSAAVTLFVGVTLILVNQGPNLTLSLRQTFMLATLSYIAIGIFAAPPFMLGSGDLSAADAIFEAMSGITTTGSTVMSDLQNRPHGILAWRAVLQWLGGIGIIAIGIVILPFLRVGGMQIFRAESSNNYEKVTPRAVDFARSIGFVYIAFTLFVMAGYLICGKPTFDAICNALTTVATGGFATHDGSIGAFDYPGVKWVAIIGMIAGSLPFVRYISLLRGDTKGFLRDSQIRSFLAVLFVVSLVLASYRVAADQVGWGEGLREALFNVTSIVSTTGYASEDYTAWGALAVVTFFVLTLIGGCTGSTTGGMKIFRFEILVLVFKTQISKLFSPNRVLPVKYNGRVVDTDVMLSVMNFLFTFLALIFLFTLILGAFGLDFITAVSGATTALANVGPGLGPVIGPAGNFQPLPETAKLVLSFAMVLGRLEFFTVLVLLNPGFWRR